MNQRHGNYATHCCVCGAKIEDNEGGEYYNFDDMIGECCQCMNSHEENPNLRNTSIQRFLIGNVL